MTGATSLAASLGLVATLALGACGQAPGPPPAADALPPPANLASPQIAPASASAGGWDGSYAGRAFLTSDPGGQLGCPNEVPVSGMKVRNGYVSFGDFQGRVRPNGTVDLPGGRDWVSGRFSAGQFVGNLYQPFPGCRYDIQLTRTAA